MALSFSQASFALALATGIKPGRVDTFISRLKQWQKMGFPDGVNVGRGVKASYGATQFFQLAFMLKLMRVGLTPQRAQAVVRSAWPRLQDAIVETMVCTANREDHIHYCLIQLDALSELKDDADHMHVFADVFQSDEIGEAFLEFEDGATEEELLRQKAASFYVKNRLAVAISIEVDSLLILLWQALATADVPPTIFSDEIKEWYEDRSARGRAPVDDDHFDHDQAAISVARFETSFDAAAVAQAMLSGVSHADDPQA